MLLMDERGVPRVRSFTSMAEQTKKVEVVPQHFQPILKFGKRSMAAPAEPESSPVAVVPASSSSSSSSSSSAAMVQPLKSPLRSRLQFRSKSKSKSKEATAAALNSGDENVLEAAQKLLMEATSVLGTAASDLDTKSKSTPVVRERERSKARNKPATLSFSKKSSKSAAPEALEAPAPKPVVAAASSAPKPLSFKRPRDPSKERSNPWKGDVAGN